MLVRNIGHHACDGDNQLRNSHTGNQRERDQDAKGQGRAYGWKKPGEANEKRRYGRQSQVPTPHVNTIFLSKRLPIAGAMTYPARVAIKPASRTTGT